ncbi:hypothetical protein M501DRAFT_479542 [Patellaria atrata CBS 101060]|uniref:Uncharacterized protein n=1 Tax=Patellaria atrata CBS 101060 TaxID=1346257 RepID=A0A9P4S4V3_9PEZI|nr:hypothetical protein M501DRAFT_479542 [Patellaria atrata CBS 101060]
MLCWGYIAARTHPILSILPTLEVVIARNVWWMLIDSSHHIQHVIPRILHIITRLMIHRPCLRVISGCSCSSSQQFWCKHWDNNGLSADYVVGKLYESGRR